MMLIRYSLVLVTGLLLLTGGPAALAQQAVGIGTAVPNVKAALEIAASDKGLLIPRLTASQRGAIAAPVPAGLLVYQTDGAQPGFWYYAATGGWTFLNPVGVGDNLGNHTATTNLGLNGNWLSNAPANANGLRIDNAGNVGVGTATPTQRLDVEGNTIVSGNATIGGTTTVGGSVGIGTTPPAASAALDVTSTTKGLLPPRMTLAQRNAISSPATGLTLYNTTSNKLNLWNGTAWQETLDALEQTNQPASLTFSYTGTVQTYTVPAGVTSLRVDASGAQGGQTGGQGAQVQTTLAVSAGQVLYLYVGGTGASPAGNAAAGGYNGGGNGGSLNSSSGGGGASDVRTSASGAAYTDRLVVAAGGGGSTARAGGAGGAPNGAAGSGIGGGTGATQTSGNALGQGGNNFSNTSSGGGGGGYWGGGFGATGGGAGGGGSSWVTPTGSSATTMTAGIRAGNGVVVLTPGLQYLPPAPVLSGVNFVNLPADNLGNHTATQNLNLANKLLVGNGGTAGLAIGSAGGVGIGTGPGGPVASAQLEVASTTKGFLPPRMSQAERNAISSPAAGLVVYNTTTNKLNTWNGTTWDAALSATEQPVLSASTTFGYTGSPGSYTVPAGVTKLVVDVIGGRGGEYISSGGGWRVYAGPGARVQSTLTVTPGEVLTINVGKAGYSSLTQNGRTYNGGGASGNGGPYPKSSGGGASDIRRGGTALTNRVVVAGGGGGGGLESNSGGAGGTPNGGSPGLNAGGGGVGGPGGSGGAGGTGAAPSAGGSAGTIGQGGDGDPTWSTGGGGGGYWGGGGGGGQGAGGGGGSSWVDPALGSNISYTLAPFGSYNGQVVLTPAPLYVAPALDGSNFVNVPGDNLGNHTATTDLQLGDNQLVGNGGTSGLSISSTGDLTVGALIGTTTRMVTTTATGTLGAAALPVDTDAQQLSKSGSTISLTNGGSVTDADNQSLTLSGASLNISGGTGIALPDASATNELQSLSKTGSTVTLSNGGGSFTDTDTDAQQLSISGQTLSISGGNSVTLPITPADNLGNHTATTTVQLNNNWLSNDGGAEGLRVDNAGNATVSGTSTVGGNAYVNGALGVVLNGQDRPLITRGFDAFTGGSYTGAGRWGVFMEPEALTFGVPAIANKRVQWVTYNASSTIAATLMTLSQDGQLGIGVAPSQQLDVNGGILARANSAISNQGAYLQWNRTGGEGETWLLNQKGGGGGYAGIRFGSATTANAVTEWARFIDNGNLGLGTGTPDAKLDIESSDPQQLILTSTSTDPTGIITVNFPATNTVGNTASELVIFSKAGQGTIGQIVANLSNNSVSYATASDRRLKENIGRTRFGLTDLLRIEVKDYNFIGTAAANRTTGFLAQDLFAIYPDAVKEGDRGATVTSQWAVDYGRLTPLLVQAIQDQQQLIDAQRAEIEALKGQNAAHVRQAAADKAQITATLESLADRLRALEAGQGQARGAGQGQARK